MRERSLLILLDFGFLALLVILIFAVLHITGINLSDVVEQAASIASNAYQFVLN